eukprot:4656420-Prymnesium_polylepis.1
MCVPPRAVASIVDIMRVQLSGIAAALDEYDLVYAQGPRWRQLDPESAEAKTLHTFFEGLPVLEWMGLHDRQTDAPMVPLGLHEDPATTSKTNARERREYRDELARRQAELGVGFPRMSGETHYYAHFERAIRTLAETVRREGPFEGFIGFSQGCNMMSIWLSLVEAGVLPSAWAAPRWVCAICGTEWGWARCQFDMLTDELAAAIGADLGAQSRAQIEEAAAAGGDGSLSARLTGGKLVTGERLGVPSLHLIGAQDPAKPYSEALTKLYSDEPTPATTAVFGHTDTLVNAGGCGDDGARLRSVVVHPEGHFPPRKKEFAAVVREWAVRWR